MASSPSLWVGVDGCRAGWFSIGFDEDGNHESQVFSSLGELKDYYADAQLILIDIPIGLPSKAGGRAVDFAARAALGVPRASSVFPVPARQAIEHLQREQGDISGARRINQEVTQQRLSQQTWGIAPKIAEVDAMIRQNDGPRPSIREIHPELLFYSFNGSHAMKDSKGTREGLAERARVLNTVAPASSGIADLAWRDFRGKGVAVDDIFDALVAALTAWLCHDHLASFPNNNPQRDTRGLPMEMVICDRLGRDR